MSDARSTESEANYHSKRVNSSKDSLLGNLRTGIGGGAVFGGGGVAEFTAYYENRNLIIAIAGAAALYLGGLLAWSSYSETRQAADWLEEAAIIAAREPRDLSEPNS